MRKKMQKIVAFALVTVIALGVLPMGALGDGGGSELDITDKVDIETGSTEEWDGGDYVALVGQDDQTWLFFGVVYGNETHHNAPTIVLAYGRVLGGADIRDEHGGAMTQDGMWALSIYMQKLAALMEFNDTGYLDKDTHERVGAGNGLFDFQGSGTILEDFDFVSVEPVYRFLELNTTWSLSPIVEKKVVGNDYQREWEFSISAYNLSYSEDWGDMEEGEDELVEEVTFTFHLGIKGKRFKESIPWYDVRIDEDSEVVSSTETEAKEFKATSVQAEFKYDHYVRGWDYTAKSDSSKLMLLNFVAFGNIIPERTDQWIDVQFGSRQESKTVAELETFEGMEEVCDSAGMPENSTAITKDTIVFKDKWKKRAEMTWVDNAEVDGKHSDVYYQIHAGESLDMDIEDEKARLVGVVFLGGYVYDAGSEIYHDPSVAAAISFIDFGQGPGIGVLFLAVGVMACATVAVFRRTRDQGPEWENTSWDTWS